MTLRGVLDALRGRWLLALLLALAGAVAGASVAMATTASYAASTCILLRWVGPNADQAITVNIRYLSERAPTYALLSTREDVLSRAIAESGVTMEPTELRDQVEAVVPLNTQTIRIWVRSPNPDNARRLANATASALVEKIAQEEGAASSGKARMDAVVVGEATTPTSPETPRVSMFVSVGTLAGWVVGVLAVIVVTEIEKGRPRRRLLVIPSPPSQRRIGLGHLVWAMMIAATIPWRTNTFYESGADPVVLAKAAISLLSLAIGGWAFKRAPHHHPVPAAPVLLMTLYFAITAVGGLANHDVVPALVVATRAMLLLASVTLLVATYGPENTTRSLVHVLGTTALLGAFSGLPNFGDRLGGVVPPLNPNALAFITAVVGIWLLAKIVAGKDAYWELFAVAGCLGVILLTGSRSTLLAGGAAAALMLFRTTAVRRFTLVVMAVALPVVTYLAIGTGLLKAVFLRGGSEQVSTLSNRTIAWDAALSVQRDWWQTWFGQGLAQKKIVVPGQWWDTQLLDSAWISALVQGGNAGALLAVVVAVATVIVAALGHRSRGAAWLGLATLTTVGGILESGLFDGSLQFMVFLVAALGAFSGHIETVASARRAVPALAPRGLSEQPRLPASPVAELP